MNFFTEGEGAMCYLSWFINILSAILFVFLQRKFIFKNTNNAILVILLIFLSFFSLIHTQLWLWGLHVEFVLPPFFLLLSILCLKKIRIPVISFLLCYFLSVFALLSMAGSSVNFFLIPIYVLISECFANWKRRMLFCITFLVIGNLTLLLYFQGISLVSHEFQNTLSETFREFPQRLKHFFMQIGALYASGLILLKNKNIEGAIIGLLSLLIIIASLLFSCLKSGSFIMLKKANVIIIMLLYSLSQSAIIAYGRSEFSPFVGKFVYTAFFVPLTAGILPILICQKESFFEQKSKFQYFAFAILIISIFLSFFAWKRGYYIIKSWHSYRLQSEANLLFYPKIYTKKGLKRIFYWDFNIKQAPLFIKESQQFDIKLKYKILKNNKINSLRIKKANKRQAKFLKIEKFDIKNQQLTVSGFALLYNKQRPADLIIFTKHNTITQKPQQAEVFAIAQNYTPYDYFIPKKQNSIFSLENKILRFNEKISLKKINKNQTIECYALDLQKLTAYKIPNFSFTLSENFFKTLNHE